jgi:hypothetical protein
MRNSLARKRTVVSNKQKQNGRNKKLGFWISVFLRVCLIGGLGAYIISTYVPNSVSGTAHVVPLSETSQAVLSLQGPQTATIKQGQILTLHGEHFGANDTITFLLDSTTPIKDESGNIKSVRASNAGGFAVLIPIQESDWPAGTHYIQAVDTGTKQKAYLNIVVSPASAPEATSQNLALSTQGKPVKKLTFTAVVGQGNPDQQRVTLTNTSGLLLHWTATANADHNLSWLVIDDNHTAGNLDISGTDSIGISVLMAGLKSNPTALLLTNLGNSFINWTLVPYDSNTTDRIQFIANGQTAMQGVLATSGNSGDTQILNLKCNGVSAGNTYKFTMYAGSSSWLVTISVRASS